MTTAAWFHPFSGIAGDMALGSLLHAGAPLDGVRDAVAALGLPGWQLRTERVQRAGIGCLRAVVEVTDTTHHRPWARIDDLLATSPLPAAVAASSRAVFRLLAEVEGGIHGIAPEAVELHEVGSLDAVVDVVGTCAALHLLGVDEVSAGPVAVGHGTVRAAHGILPNPAPAVVALLAGAGVPAYGVDVPLELTTPTGAALLAGLAAAFGPLPAMTVASVGYGAGGRDLPDRPNATQVVIGTLTDSRGMTMPGQPVVELEANVDDVTGEVLAHTVAALLAAGAHDAWVVPIVMKKGRPAHTVHALADPALVAAVGDALLRETGSLGVRATRLERWPQSREERVVDVDGHPVRVKVTAGRVKAEHDDAAAAAAALGRPLRQVLAQAEAAGTTGPASG
jgi:pyridinium-3,5-bisthiocarboxylic acid mononucleotide nickel chelatase